MGRGGREGEGRRGSGEMGGGGGGERGEGYSHDSWDLSMGRVSLCYSIDTTSAAGIVCRSSPGYVRYRSTEK